MENGCHLADSSQLPSGFQLDEPAVSGNPSQADSAELTAGIPQGFQLDEDKYGSAGQTAIATAEAAARAATLGTSTIAEKALGVSPQDISGREAQLSPWLSVPASIAGAAIPVALTGGAAAPAEGVLLARGVAPLAARALGYGAEGAIFGAGNAVNDAALGDPNLNAQKILQDVGFGFATSAGLGVLSKTLKALPAFRRAAQSAEEAAAGTAPGTPPPEGPVAPKKPVASLEEAAERLETARKTGLSTTRPQAEAAQDALSRVDLGEWNPPAPQLESIANPDQVNPWNLSREMSGDVGDKVRGIEAAQKQEAMDQLDKTIGSLSPENTPVSDARAGGSRSNDIFSQRYSDVQEATMPALQALKETGIGTADHLTGVVETLTNANPNLASMFDATGNDISIKPFSAKMGITQDTYNSIKGVVSDLSSGDTSIQDLMNIRNGMGSGIDLTKTGSGINEVGRLKAAMMSYIENQIQEHVPDMQVRAPLRAWAINEGYREAIEGGFGASVGKPEVGVLSKIVPENINDNIFKNSSTVQTAKNFLPPKEFNEIVANWLSEQRAKVTTDGVFSSNKFATILKNNQDALNTALEGNPTLQRMHDINTIMRLFPDSKSINPSGTAKTFLGSLSFEPTKLLKGLGEYSMEKIHERAARNSLNASLAGMSDTSSKLDMISKMLRRHDKLVDQKVKAIFGK